MLTVIIAIFLFRKQKNALKILSAFLLLSLLLQFLIIYLNVQHKNNLYLFHIYTPIEFSTLSILFYLTSLRRSSKSIVVVICAMFITFCIVSAFFLQPLKDFNSISRGVEGILAIGLCTYFFYELFVAEESIDILKFPFFWLFAGWLIYFAGTFFLFIYANHSVTNLTYPLIHSILNIFLNLVYTYVLWLGSRKSTS